MSDSRVGGGGFYYHGKILRAFPIAGKVLVM